MRKQYHLRDSEKGLLAWDVDRLVALTCDLPPVTVLLRNIKELDEPFWFGQGDAPTCRRVSEHARLIRESSLEHPIILDPDGRVMDGMHRECKALISGRSDIQAYRLEQLPEPDFIGVPADKLPYEEDQVEPGAAPSNRPPFQLPTSPEVQPSDSLRTPSSGGSG